MITSVEQIKAAFGQEEVGTGSLQKQTGLIYMSGCEL